MNATIFFPFSTYVSICFIKRNQNWEKERERTKCVLHHKTNRNSHIWHLLTSACVMTKITVCCIKPKKKIIISETRIVFHWTCSCCCFFYLFVHIQVHLWSWTLNTNRMCVWYVGDTAWNQWFVLEIKCAMKTKPHLGGLCVCWWQYYYGHIERARAHARTSRIKVDDGVDSS